MDSRQLASFVAVATHLSFRRAADALDISQPALSQQIRALEADLDVKLFERTTRQVRLTNAGRVFLDEARDLLQSTESARNRAHDAERGTLGELVVSASTPTAFGDLPRIVRAFRKRYPGVLVRIKIMPSRDVPAALGERSVHLAIGRAPANNPLVRSRALWQHAYWAALYVHHPLAHLPVIALHDLHGDSLVIYARSMIGERYDQVLALCHAHGFTPATIETVTGIDSLLGFVSCGSGVAVIAAPWAHAITLPDIVFRPLALADGWTYGVSASWHANETSPLVPAFVDVAAAADSALPHAKSAR